MNPAQSQALARSDLLELPQQSGSESADAWPLQASCLQPSPHPAAAAGAIARPTHPSPCPASPAQSRPHSAIFSPSLASAPSPPRIAVFLATADVRGPSVTVPIERARSLAHCAPAAHLHTRDDRNVFSQLRWLASGRVPGERRIRSQPVSFRFSTGHPALNANNSSVNFRPAPASASLWHY